MWVADDDGCSVADRLKHEQPLDERLKNEFMLQQLVSLISSLDLADELARFVFPPLLNIKQHNVLLLNAAIRM